MASIYSMTAFGRCINNNTQSSVECELKTLNNRYLEINLKLPDSTLAHEAVLREKVKKQLSRGKLEVTIRIKSSGGQQLSINTEALQALNQAIKTVSDHSPTASAANHLELLRWPGVMQEASDPALDDLLQNTFDTALNDLCQSRLREGETLAKCN